MSKYSYLEARICKLEQDRRPLSSEDKLFFENALRVRHEHNLILQGENNTLRNENDILKDRIKRLLKLIDKHATEICELKAKYEKEPFVTLSQHTFNGWRDEVKKLEQIKNILKEDNNDDNGSR